MKRTVNVNIGSCAFVLDEDAYRVMDKYLRDIRSRLDRSEADEIITDIETRIAELFRERISGVYQVVTLDTVRRTIAIIGRPEDFGRSNDTETRYNRYEDERSEPRYSQPRRLTRSTTNSRLGGVCGGLAEYWDADPLLVRLLFVIFFFCGVSIWVYILMWIFIPRDTEVSGNRHSNYKK